MAPQRAESPFQQSEPDDGRGAEIDQEANPAPGDARSQTANKATADQVTATGQATFAAVDDSETPALDRLSEATRAFRSRRDTRHQGYTASIIATIAIALCGGALGWITTPGAYECEIRIDVDPVVHDLAIHAIAAELPGRRAGNAMHWTARPLSETQVSVVGYGDDRQALQANAVVLAERLVGAIDESVNSSAATPSDAEIALSDQVERLTSWIKELEADVTRSNQAIPSDDPTLAHRSLVNRWDSARQDFDTLRTELLTAGLTLDQLRTSAPPGSGTVSTQERAKAMASNEPLQEDLSELEVRLNELKLHMLNAWQQSADELDRLREARRMIEDAADRHAPGSRSKDDESTDDWLTLFAATVRDYGSRFDEFSRHWTAEFTGLRELKPDPMSRDILDRHENARAKLRDFMFRGAQLLLTLRRTLDEPTENEGNIARFHVKRSELMRLYESLRRNHDRFEFAANAIEPMRNFRLDSALESSRGLHRRTTARISSIEVTLQEKARKRAALQHTYDIREAEEKLQRMRGTVDEAVDKLIAIQADINSVAAESESFVQHMAARDVLRSQLQRVRQETITTETRLEDARRGRSRVADARQAAVGSRRTLRVAPSRHERFIAGGRAAVFALFAATFAQAWVINFRRRNQAKRQ